MADDDVNVMSDGDDNRCDTLPPTKKYKQSRLSFFVSASADGADHEGDGEVSSSTSTSVRGRVPDQHVTAACGSDCCAGGLTPFQPTDTATLKKLRKKQGDRYHCFSSSWYSTFPWLAVCVTRGKAFCVVCRYCSEKNFWDYLKRGRCIHTSWF